MATSTFTMRRPHAFQDKFTRATPRMVADKEPLTFDSDDLVKSFTLTEHWFQEGVLFFALADLPNFTNAITGALSIENKNSDEIYTKGSLAKNTKTKINVCSDGNDVPLADTSTVKLTLSGVAGGSGGTAYITLYVL